MIAYAPIALFVYNRPLHAKRTVEALLNNAEAARTALLVFSDAPRNHASSEAVDEVRAYIRSVRGFKSVSIEERQTNFGLARSIIDGVTRTCEEFGRVIVVEDDLQTSPYFLAYINDALSLYKEVERVISIHGYQYPVRGRSPETFFLRGADCWGWATWKRGWDLFEADGQTLLQALVQRKLTHRFDFDGAFPYTNMLKAQIRGKNDSWAIRWYASAFLLNKLTLYPGRSLVANFGHDGTGTHCSTTSGFVDAVSNARIRVEQIPIEEQLFVREQIGELFRMTRLERLKKRVLALSNIGRKLIRGA